MTDLEAAWDAVHDNTPEGWCVGKPDFEERYNQWSMYAFDPSEKPIVGKRSREWTACQVVGDYDSGGQGGTPV